MQTIADSTRARRLRGHAAALARGSTAGTSTRQDMFSDLTGGETASAILGPRLRHRRARTWSSIDKGDKVTVTRGVTIEGADGLGLPETTPIVVSNRT